MSFLKTIFQGKNVTMPSKDVHATVQSYANEFSNGKDHSAEDAIDAAGNRVKNYTSIVKNYYYLATDFYEYGWGTSFHFGERHISETLPEAIKKAEYRLAAHLGLKPGMKVMDVGCGVGGPARNLALFSGANITGINIHEYQIKRAEMHTERAGLQHLVKYIKTDFMELSKVVPESSMDAAYAIEATVHAPSLAGVYHQVYKTLKPGGQFACYEWCLTDKYDSNNKEHRSLKLGIELGNGIPNLVTTKEATAAMKEAGFDVIHAHDTLLLCNEFYIPWYEIFLPKFTLSQFKLTPMGRFCLQMLLGVLELVRIAPKGTGKMHRILMDNATCLARAGQLGIFTPQFLIIAKKN